MVIGENLTHKFDLKTKIGFPIIKIISSYFLNHSPTRGKHYPRQCLYQCRNVQPFCQIWDVPFSDHNGVLVDLENVTNKIRTEVTFFLGILYFKNIIPKNKFVETSLTLASNDWQALCISIKYVIAKKPFSKSLSIL